MTSHSRPPYTGHANGLPRPPEAPAARQTDDGGVVRILLADDHQLFREALCHLLRTQADLQVVAQTGDGSQVLELARATAPDIVCMDVHMPGVKGIEVTRQVLAELPQVRVVALTADADAGSVLGMMRAGASAYVTKAETSDELLLALRAVQRGRSYLCSEVADVFAEAVRLQDTAPPRTTSLGARERQVLELVARGLTSHQIADQMHIAKSTVEVHRRNIMRKLSLHSVAELTRYVIYNEQRFL